MTELADEFLRQRFAAMIESTDDSDWDEIRTRIQRERVEAMSRPGGVRRSVSARRLQVGLVAAVLVASAAGVFTTSLGAAIGRTFDGFSAWVTGEPGTPATAEEQQGFERANDRSWAGFPAGTDLRRLLRTQVSGTSFTLFGFRSGDSLCLRLVATGAAAGTAMSCAPLQALQASTAPALVIAADDPFGLATMPEGQTGYVPPSASATFGIVSDGVAAVTLNADGGEHDALLSGNAFLYVADHPKIGERVRAATATAADGATVRLPLAVAPFGTHVPPSPPAAAQGPTGVERIVSDGTIGWFDHGPLPGEPLSPEQLERFEHLLTSVSLAREIQPDPGNPVKVAIVVGGGSKALGTEPGQPAVCVGLDFGVGCGSLPGLFSHTPFSVGVITAEGGDQYADVGGAASDDVSSMTIVLANGAVETVPLADNAYVVAVPRVYFPARIIAYDAKGEIIGNEVVTNR